MTSTKRVILVRHGETWANREGRILGRSDSPLTPEGIHVAGQLADIIAHERLGICYSSSLGRALASAKIYLKGSGCLLLPRSAMCELSCGSWEGKHKNEVMPDKTAIRSTWFEKPPGGESYSDAEERLKPFIVELNSSKCSEPALVVGHAGINRVFLKLWLDLSPEDAVKVHFAHDMVCTLNGKELAGTSLTLGPFARLIT
jgi:uncharacterized phosphatase